VKRAVAAALALLISWTGSAGEKAMSPTIQEVKAKHAPRFLALPGVVSMGIGRDADGHEVIVIGLDRARPETQASLPAQLDGYRVRVEIIGTVKAR
jgi:hypothetical protein